MPAAPLPNARLQFVDINGAPLEGGTVGYYEPGGLTPRDTWADYGQQTLNDNPLTLNERGQASVWGNGRYRQVVKDSLGNLIWDDETFVLSGALPYEVGFYWPDAPSANDMIASWNFTQAVIFPTNFAGAYGAVNTTPSGAIDLDVRLNGTSAVGTISISTGGIVTFSTSITDPQYNPGDRLTVHVQSGGVNGAAGISATFLGALTS